MPLIKKFGDEMPDVAKKSLPTDKGRTLPCRPASAPALTPAPSGRTTRSRKPVAAPAPRSSARASRSKTAAPPPSSARAPQVVYPAQQGGVLFSTLMMTLLSTDSAAWREKMSLFKEQARSIHTPPLAPPLAHHQCTPPPQMIKTLDNANRAGKLPEALDKLLPALISNLTRHLTHSAGGAGEPHTPEEGQARSSPPHALASPCPAAACILSALPSLAAPRPAAVVGRDAQRRDRALRRVQDGLCHLRGGPPAHPPQAGRLSCAPPLFNLEPTPASTSASKACVAPEARVTVPRRLGGHPQAQQDGRDRPGLPRAHAQAHRGPRRRSLQAVRRGAHLRMFPGPARVGKCVPRLSAAP